MATLKVPDLKVPDLKVPDLHDRVGGLGEYLREQRESARLSLRQLAQAAGVSNPYLSQIERGLRRPSAEVLQQIAKGLQISAEALYLRAGILEASEGLQVETAVHGDLHLTARQKRVLLDIYATFRAENARAEAEPPPARPSTARRAPATTKATAEPAATRATASAAKKATRKTTTRKPAQQATKRADTRTTARRTGESGPH